MIALYKRVSTLEQSENGHSLAEQEERMTKFADAMGWKIFKVYTDAGFSGANTERPALQQLIKDVKNGKVDRVLVYKLDRLSRSQKDTLMLIEDIFLKNGCDFVSMSENFDTSNAFGRAMIGILAVFAQLEREQIKERMSMGKDARAKLGKWNGSMHLPIGYEYIDGELVTNESEKEQVIQIFHQYAQGKSPYDIANDFNELGLSTKYGKWNGNTIRNIISKRTYLGELYFRGKWHDGTHEAFIDEELWEKANAIRLLKSEQARKNNMRQGKASSYLAGFLVCGCCGGKYAKNRQYATHKGVKYVYEYYSCNSRTKKRPYYTGKACNNKHWKMQELDALIFGEIAKLTTDCSQINSANENDLSLQNALKKEKNKVEEQLSKLMDLYSVGGIPLDALQERIHGLNDKKIALEKKLAELEEEKKNKLTVNETMSLVNSFADVLKVGNYDEIRNLLGALIDKIIINNDDVEIHWRFE